MWARNRHWHLLFPSLLFMALFFFGGIRQGLWESLGLMPLGGDASFSIRPYIDILSSPDYWESWRLSMKIGLFSTLISSVIALSMIYVIFSMKIQDDQRSNHVYRLFLAPMIFPYIVAGGIMYLLFLKSGWISRLFYSLGWIDMMESFPAIIGNKAGWGIIMAYVWKTSPFIVLMLYPALMDIDRELVESARLCGAGSFSVFRSILFPAIKPPLKTSSFLVFSYTFGAFELPFMLGVTWPRALSVYAWQVYNGGDLAMRPVALAINVTILITVLLVGMSFYLIPQIMKKQTR